MGSLHEIPSSLYLHALPHQPHSAQSDAGVTCVEGLLFFLSFFKIVSFCNQAVNGDRLPQTPKHWFGGRCRKAMLGVQLQALVYDILPPWRKVPENDARSVAWSMPPPSPLHLSASSDRQSLYSQAVRDDSPPPPHPSPLPLSPSSERQSLYSQAVRGHRPHAPSTLALFLSLIHISEPTRQS